MVFFSQFTSLNVKAIPKIDLKKKRHKPYIYVPTTQGKPIFSEKRKLTWNKISFKKISIGTYQFIRSLSVD